MRNLLTIHLRLGLQHSSTCIFADVSRCVQVHCVKAFAELQKFVQQEQPFNAGLLLHSWSGPQHMVAPLAAIPNVYFSISGHSLRSDKKAAGMLKEVRQ